MRELSCNVDKRCDEIMAQRQSLRMDRTFTSSEVQVEDVIHGKEPMIDLEQMEGVRRLLMM